MTQPHRAQRLRLALIYGSTRPGRLCDRIGLWAIAEIERHGGYDLDVIDPLKLDPERDAAALSRRVGAADAFVVLTPEYNRSFPAPLKALIDGLSDEWGAKPVGFISYGGVSGGLRAVEQLRLVFAELHAVGIRDGVSFADVWGRFDEDGVLRDSARAEKAITTTLTRLAWWARALRSARAADAYGKAA